MNGKTKHKTAMKLQLMVLRSAAKCLASTANRTPFKQKRLHVGNDHSWLSEYENLHGQAKVLIQYKTNDSLIYFTVMKKITWFYKH